MQSKYSVQLGALVKEFNLKLLRGAENWEECPVRTEEVSRPGLPLTGFFDYFDPRRIQVIGRVEDTYLAGLTPEERRRSFDRLFSHELVCLVIARGMEPWPECMEMAEKYDRTILQAKESTCTVMSGLVTRLNAELCPRITRHGVLLEVYGEGVLLLGESGIGKSETAIELIKRGHRLIADDAVEIKQISGQRLVGSAPELIRHYMELRGIGVVNMRQLFGMSAVKDSQEIDLVIHLEPWEDGAVYDRLGLEDTYTSILDVKLPCATIPVKPGRNLAVIIEVAVMNDRQKKMGYNAARTFAREIDEHFDRQLNKM